MPIPQLRHMTHAITPPHERLSPLKASQHYFYHVVTSRRCRRPATPASWLADNTPHAARALMTLPVATATATFTPLHTSVTFTPRRLQVNITRHTIRCRARQHTPLRHAAYDNTTQQYATKLSRHVAASYHCRHGHIAAPHVTSRLFGRKATHTATARPPARVQPFAPLVRH